MTVTAPPLASFPKRLNAQRLLGATLISAAFIAGCGDSGVGPDLASCPTDTTPIHAIQGTDWNSPLVGRSVAVTGVVTHVAGDGLYVESLSPDDDPETSEGLFLATDSEPASHFVTGKVVTAEGTVAELGEVRDTKTSLTRLASLETCGPPRARPQTAISLPLGGRQREALENMRVTLGSASVVTDVYRLHDGAFRVALDGPLPQPTEVSRPGQEANDTARRNRARSLHARLFEDDAAVFAVGDELLSDEGVLGNLGRGTALLLEAPARVYRAEIPTPEPAVRGASRIVSLNLENYFNGDGAGGGFPTPRGAESATDFERQRERFAELLPLLGPDIVAVQEIENDGFGPRSAIRDFQRLLESSTGGQWAVAEPRADSVGSDQIAVGLLYRADRFEPVGPAVLLDAAPFDLLNRTPLGQTLQHRDTGDRIFVTVNHFKSKGGCPDQGRDQDQRDGQGCWNPARRDAARALGPWVTDQSEQNAGGKALILGDLNAYRMEDPVQQLLIDGFKDITATIGERHRYSYVYAGQSGTLDHAIASIELVGRVVEARILNINARFPRRLPLEPGWVGSSDHDPVIVDVRFAQSFTSD